MKRDKATGPDKIPVEVYINSEYCRHALFDLIIHICRDECCPEDFVTSEFCPIYKKKGSHHDFSKYRYICLLNHSYKLLSAYLLTILIDEIEDELPDNQYGFRRLRGTRDAIFVLQQIVQNVVRNAQDAYVAFIDFTAAFDSVSHKFLDRCLKQMGASDSS